MVDDSIKELIQEVRTNPGVLIDSYREHRSWLEGVLTQMHLNLSTLINLKGQTEYMEGDFDHLVEALRVWEHPNFSLRRLIEYPTSAHLEQAIDGIRTMILFLDL